MFAVNQFKKYSRKVTNNLTNCGFCFKADIKHYFNEVDHKILLQIIKEKISEKNIIWLINEILAGGGGEQHQGMPLGNYNSQFFANLYLHKFDHFIKHNFKAKYYVRYVDDFIILHKHKKQLKNWKEQISIFLKEKLKLELHPQKSRIIPLSRGIDFVGFRIFLNHKLPRKRNLKKMHEKINLFEKGNIEFLKLKEIHQGWQAHSNWSNTHKLKLKIKDKIIDSIIKRV